MRTILAFPLLVAVGLPSLAVEAAAPVETPAAEKGLSLVVMDPLAAPLSCPCVQGYAQRRYEKLAEYLTVQLGRPVHVTFAESFDKALSKEGCDGIDIAIGKDSVVRHDAAATQMKVTPLGLLTGKDGKTTQTGLIVVRSTDPAHAVSDLRGYRILFGPRECDEKFAAARLLLTAAGIAVPPPESAETSAACSDGACKIIDWGDSQKAAAVISSYAAPLLEGCGTIKKGDLRVVGETAPVPFITAFATNRVDAALRDRIRAALLSAGTHAEMLAALETLVGFVPLDDNYLPSESATPSVRPTLETERPKAKATSAWPGWRGPARDGRVDFLPSSLPTKPQIVWRQPLRRAGLGGIAATDEYVILGDRDVSNTFDQFRCYAAEDGKLLWTTQYPAPGQLDYDNTPRATPLVHDGRAYLLGAFGDLSCVEIATGAMLWQMNILKRYGGESELVWGTCSSPLVADEKLIVNPGGAEASVVALDPETGDMVWQSPGDRHAYASFIVATLGGVRQLVGYDRSSLIGRDLATGRRLWTLTPPHGGDFNVPTPLAVDGRLLVMTENNHARIYDFESSGRIIPQPSASNDQFSPDVSSPVVAAGRAFCVAADQMFCLDLASDLRTVWTGDDRAFCNYSPLIASDDRLLAFGRGGELLLMDARSDRLRIISRLSLFDGSDAGKAEMLAHPALVGTRLYVRGEKEWVCAELAPATTDAMAENSTGKAGR
jgi:outer membrane protein assembly factor BamB/ABC-type phosphate/phosphonate transport system substrate-binding protein